MHTSESSEDLPCITSVHPLETNAHRYREQTASQWKIHARHNRERLPIIGAMENDGNPALAKRARRMDGCCSLPEIRRRADGLPGIRLNACRDRMCPRCQRQRGLAVKEKVLAAVEKFNAPRFFTLTMRHRDEPLSKTRARANEAFRLLRRQTEWTSRVTGGVWVIETTRNRETKRWHLHLHVIADGSYFPQELLSRAWERVTGDSKIVDVRAVPDRKKAVGYLADYLAKPMDVVEWGDDAICEYADAMHGARLIATFGKAHKSSVEAAEPEAESGPTTFVIQTCVLRRLANEGNVKAQFAVITLGHYRRSICEALGKDWKRPENMPALVHQADLITALRLCEELERGLFVDAPPAVRAADTRQRQPVLFDTTGT